MTTNRATRGKQTNHLNGHDLKKKSRKRKSAKSSTERKKRVKFQKGCQVKMSNGATCGAKTFLGAAKCPNHGEPMYL